LIRQRPPGHEWTIGEARARFVYKIGAPCKVASPAADNTAMELLKSSVSRVAA